MFTWLSQHREASDSRARLQKPLLPSIWTGKVVASTSRTTGAEVALGAQDQALPAPTMDVLWNFISSVESPGSLELVLSSITSANTVSSGPIDRHQSVSNHSCGPISIHAPKGTPAQGRIGKLVQESCETDSLAHRGCMLGFPGDFVYHRDVWSLDSGNGQV